MKLLQLRYLCEIARRQFNLSEVARIIRASQPGISRQIQLLETELGFDILARRGKRIVGLTPEGEAVLVVAKRMESDAESLLRMRRDRRAHEEHLTVATTHFHARYTLVETVLKFRKARPDVSLNLHQSDPLEIARQVETGEADLGFGPAPARLDRQVMAFPCDLARTSSQSAKRTLIAPSGHPLLKVKKLTLQAIAAHPMIMYGPKKSIGSSVMQTFEQHGLHPDVVLTATDGEVIKTYVREGLGIAILQRPVAESSRDPKLRAIDVSQLFKPSKTVLMMQRASKISGPTRDFVVMVAPDFPFAEADEASAGPLAARQEASDLRRATV